MLQTNRPFPRWLVLLQAGFVYTWLTVLSPLSVTDTYYSVYILCALAGVLCMYDCCRWGFACRPGQRAVLLVFAGLFSGSVALANYPLFAPLSVLQNLFDLVCCLAGGVSIGYAVLLCLLNRLPLTGDTGARFHPGRVFWGVFLTVAAIDLGYLYLALYPGVLTTDSFSTIGQILGLHPYNNVMPFWHTVTVEVFVDLGLWLFGDINAAVALFHSAQILLLAAAFAAALTTMYQIGVPWLLMAASYGIYALLPHNIAYSVTLWKDIPFAAAALLMVTGLYRLLGDIGRRRWLNCLALVAGALGFALWRTNGWYAFAVVTVLMVLLLRRSHRNLVRIVVVLLVVTWAMIGPVLSGLDVVEINYVEAFGIPMQQIARVVHLDLPLTPTEEALLSEVFYLDRVKELYDPQIVDPIKFYTFRQDRLPYLMDHWQEYLKVYLGLGLRYPGEYLKAWVEQTKGYWQGGYFYWTYTLQMGDNSFGIYQTPGQGLPARLYAALFRYLEKPEILQCFVSIGLHTWTLVSCCVLTALQKRRECFLTIPILVLIGGLWLGTPVFAEFRYAYPMILTMPMIFTATLYGRRNP